MFLFCFVVGFNSYVIRGRLPYTLAHGPPDHECTEAAEKHKPIQYPKPDGVITFDLLTSLYRSSTNHEHDQPPHLHLVDKHVPETINLPKFAAPESRYCPARVYEYTQISFLLALCHIHGWFILRSLL
jgi:electron-transferring-flavoprotein dehydrogenase